MSYILIHNNCPNPTVARQIAESLLENRLAACVNILPSGTSVYRWQGKIESAEECLLLIKTVDKRYNAVEETIQQLHPYELPEVIAVPISKGLPAYLDWLGENTIYEQ